mgnify:CR=1 FL=1
MLVLTRRPEESLVLTLPGAGEPIVVAVLGVDGDKVRLGIQAPRSVTVLRRELCEAVREQNLAAARRASDASALPAEALRRLLGERESERREAAG